MDTDEEAEIELLDLDGNDFEDEGNEGEDEEEADDDSEAYEEQVYADGKIIIQHGSYISGTVPIYNHCLSKINLFYRAFWAKKTL